MVIIITGTPGTGKSTLAKQLSTDLNPEAPLRVVNITALAAERGLDEEWDDKRNCFLVDVEALTDLLVNVAKGDPKSIIEGHLAHHLPPEHVDRCIITKCELPELKKRLEARGYDEQKVRENLDVEIFDVCHTEALEFGHDCEVVWTDGSEHDPMFLP